MISHIPEQLIHWWVSSFREINATYGCLKLYVVLIVAVNCSFKNVVIDRWVFLNIFFNLSNTFQVFFVLNLTKIFLDTICLNNVLLLSSLKHCHWFNYLTFKCDFSVQIFLGRLSVSLLASHEQNLFLKKVCFSELIILYKCLSLWVRFPVPCLTSPQRNYLQ